MKKNVNISFLPEEEAAVAKVKEIFKESLGQKDIRTLTKDEAEIIIFDFEEKINKKFNFPFNLMPEFYYSSFDKSFNCPTGEYIFFIKKIKNYIF